MANAASVQTSQDLKARCAQLTSYYDRYGAGRSENLRPIRDVRLRSTFSIGRLRTRSALRNWADAVEKLGPTAGRRKIRTSSGVLTNHCFAVGRVRESSSRRPGVKIVFQQHRPESDISTFRPGLHRPSIPIYRRHDHRTDFSAADSSTELPCGAYGMTQGTRAGAYAPGPQQVLQARSR
jgi:hypothetical protein